MNRRPNSIAGLLVHYTQLRLNSPATRGRTMLAVGLVGAGLTGGMSLLASHTHCRTQSAIRLTSVTSNNVATRQARAQVRATQCLTLRTHGHATRRCMPQWFAERAITGGRTMDAPGAAESFSVTPSIVRGGDGYGVAYSLLTEDRADVYFQRLSLDGQRVGAPSRISSAQSGELALLPDVVWTGSGFAIAWTAIRDEEALDVFVARVDASGARQGDVIKVSTSREMDLFARVAWTGQRIAVAWLRFNGEDSMSARLSLYDAQGTRVGAERVIREGFLTLGMPSLLTSGANLTLTYNAFDLRRGQCQLLVQRIDGDGKAQAPVVVNAERKINAAVAAAIDGESVSVAWEDGMFEEETNTLAFARVTGSRIDVRRTPLTNGRSASFQPSAATGTEGTMGLAWSDNRSGRFGVLMQRVGRNGRVAGEPMRLNPGQSEALFPSVTWSGSEYAVAWSDTRRGDLGVYVARVGADGRRVGEDVRVSP
ncbi:MAG: hypothetical protein Q8Q09_22115 [Deltaproteobacteria bacterium]|nr:hypothetical protein [Deltaproteobacteria bacterium]